MAFLVPTLRREVVLGLVILLCILTVPVGASQNCLAPDKVEELLMARESNVSRYLTEAAFNALLQAQCVVKEATLYRAAFGDGKDITIRWVGKPETGHLFEIVRIERTTEPILQGLETEPRSASAFRVVIRTGILAAEDVEIWHFPGGMRLVKFYDRTNRNTLNFTDKPYSEWAFKTNEIIIFYKPRPTRTSEREDGFSARYMELTGITVSDPHLIPAQIMRNFALAVKVTYKWTVAMLDFIEDRSWQQ